MKRCISRGTEGAVLGSYTISSFEQAVIELMKNSIDASATEIKVALDPRNLSATVQDNGHGLVFDELGILGTPSCTSYKSQGRLHGRFGGRGLSVFALASTSQLEIQSRAKGEFQTWVKLVSSKPVSVARLASKQQPDCGTLATLSQFMSQIPVRRKQLLGNRYHIIQCLNVMRLVRYKVLTRSSDHFNNCLNESMLHSLA